MTQPVTICCIVTRLWGLISKIQIKKAKLRGVSKQPSTEEVGNIVWRFPRDHKPAILTFVVSFRLGRVSTVSHEQCLKLVSFLYTHMHIYGCCMPGYACAHIQMHTHTHTYTQKILSQCCKAIKLEIHVKAQNIII